jgi:adenine-specific DNA-methyltransferase
LAQTVLFGFSIRHSERVRSIPLCCRLPRPVASRRQKAFEIDRYYGEPARRLWKETGVDIELSDFTQSRAPSEDSKRFNLLVCNPPYVRHHHIANGEKQRLQNSCQASCGVRIGGLAGLYCYFVGLSHLWIQRGGIAGWLIPSEFMDVNYGRQLKRYLLDKVTLLRIHRFDPNDVQFEDAFVSSAIVWYRNVPPGANHKVDFTFGGSLSNAKIARTVSIAALRNEAKWTRFPIWERVEFTVEDFTNLNLTS